MKIVILTWTTEETRAANDAFFPPKKNEVRHKTGFLDDWTIVDDHYEEIVDNLSLEGNAISREKKWKKFWFSYKEVNKDLVLVKANVHISTHGVIRDKSIFNKNGAFFNNNPHLNLNINPGLPVTDLMMQMINKKIPFDFLITLGTAGTGNSNVSLGDVVIADTAYLSLRYKTQVWFDNSKTFGNNKLYKADSFVKNINSKVLNDYFIQNNKKVIFDYNKFTESIKTNENLKQYNPDNFITSGLINNRKNNKLFWEINNPKAVLTINGFLPSSINWQYNDYLMNEEGDAAVLMSLSRLQKKGLIVRVASDLVQNDFLGDVNQNRKSIAKANKIFSTEYLYNKYGYAATLNGAIAIQGILDQLNSNSSASKSTTKKPVKSTKKRAAKRK